MNDRGNLRKMKTRLVDGAAVYELPLGEEGIPLAPLLGRPFSLRFLGEIHCIHCGRKTSRSFSQGYCFPCMRTLARCDRCIVRPELCHYAQGSCREPEWGRENCLRPHVVYLANTSGIKVGITRERQLPCRWIDQGATQALAILKVASRHLAGLVEVVLKQHVSDRTQWQRMLKGEGDALDLAGERDRLLALCREEIRGVSEPFGAEAVVELAEGEPLTIRYPVLQYPSKARACSFDRTANVGGTLLGIKGQYLIFDSGVINVRKFAGYRVKVEA